MIHSLKYLSLFVWLLGAGALYGVYVSYGLPHVIWNYTFLDNGDRYNLFAERHYLSCSFIGPYGVFKMNAQNGRCDWVLLFRTSDQ